MSERECHRIRECARESVNEGRDLQRVTKNRICRTRKSQTASQDFYQLFTIFVTKFLMTTLILDDYSDSLYFKMGGKREKVTVWWVLVPQ